MGLGRNPQPELFNGGICIGDAGFHDHRVNISYPFVSVY